MVNDCASEILTRLSVIGNQRRGAVWLYGTRFFRFNFCFLNDFFFANCVHNMGHICAPRGNCFFFVCAKNNSKIGIFCWLSAFGFYSAASAFNITTIIAIDKLMYWQSRWHPMPFRIFLNESLPLHDVFNEFILFAIYFHLFLLFCCACVGSLRSSECESSDRWR